MLKNTDLKAFKTRVTESCKNKLAWMPNVSFDTWNHWSPFLQTRGPPESPLHEVFPSPPAHCMLSCWVSGDRLKTMKNVSLNFSVWRHLLTPFQVKYIKFYLNFKISSLQVDLTTRFVLDEWQDSLSQLVRLAVDITRVRLTWGRPPTWGWINRLIGMRYSKFLTVTLQYIVFIRIEFY